MGVGRGLSGASKPNNLCAKLQTHHLKFAVRMASPNHCIGFVVYLPPPNLPPPSPNSPLLLTLPHPPPDKNLANKGQPQKSGHEANRAFQWDQVLYCPWMPSSVFRPGTEELAAFSVDTLTALSITTPEFPSARQPGSSL